MTARRPCPAPGCGLDAHVLDCWVWHGIHHYELECPAGHYYPGWIAHA